MPKLPSQKIQPRYDDVNKKIDNDNKALDDLINNIKSKQSIDLINKKLHDTVNNTGNRRLDLSDIDLSPEFDSLRDLVDKINKDKDKSDQMDFDELTELTKARLKLDNLKPAESIEPEDYSNIFRQSRARTRAPASKIKKSKILDNAIDSLDVAIEGLDKPGPPRPPRPLGPPGVGERFAILFREDEIKNMYDNIDYLNNKLKDDNLTFAEYKKISDDIDQIKKYVLKKEQELYEASKQDLLKIKINSLK